MRSFLAALRTLTLPWGVTSSTRIVLDGVNGLIELFNAMNIETGQIDTDGIHLYDDAGNEVVTIARLVGDDRPLVRVQDAQGEAYISMSLDSPGGTDEPILDMVGYTGPGELGIPAHVYANVTGTLGSTARMELEIRAGTGGSAETATIKLRSESTDATIPARILVDKPVIIEGAAGAWKPLTGATGWAVSGNAEYRILPTGMAVFRGRLTGGTNTVGTAVTTALPAADRPATGGPRFTCTPGSGTGTDGIIAVIGGVLTIGRVFSSAAINLDSIFYSTI